MEQSEDQQGFEEPLDRIAQDYDRRVKAEHERAMNREAKHEVN